MMPRFFAFFFPALLGLSSCVGILGDYNNGTTGTDAGGTGDGGPTTDGGPLPDDNCRLGKTAAGRCAEFAPSGVVTPVDLAATDVEKLALTAGDTIVNVDTGAITNGATAVRVKNANLAQREVRNGV